jgi:cell division protein FtsI/penicillin-binding protein 2
VGFRRRLAILLAGTALALLAVWLRVGWVQVATGERWRARGEAARSTSREVEAVRGRIVDADGRVLATDRSVLRLAFSPDEWASRARFRCSSCGTVAFRRSAEFAKPMPDGSRRTPTPPTRCGCGARADAFSRLGEDGFEPLEDELGVPHGALAAFARAKMAEAESRVAASVAEAALGLREGALKARARARKRSLEEMIAEVEAEVRESDAFRLEDVRRMVRDDLLRREVVVRELPGGATGPVALPRLPEAAVRRLELDADGRYRGFRCVEATERWYPYHGLLAQCLGYADPARADEVRRARADIHEGRDDDGVADVSGASRVGRTGLERQYDAVLRGRRGREVRERDEDGLFTVRRDVVPAVRGGDVRLWLHADACQEAQRQLESALELGNYALPGPASGGFVVADADTGAVLAWAEAPVFDLGGDRDAVTQRVDKDEEDAAKGDAAPAEGEPLLPPPEPGLSLSRNARVAVEPGSAMKLVTAISLLDGGVTMPEAFVCTGTRDLGIHDRPKCSHNHEPVGLEEAICLSCNRYFALLAGSKERFEAHRVLFPSWAARLGFGQGTGVDLPSTGVGLYPRSLDPGRLRMIAIGQSMTATPLHMTRVACLLANGHRLPIPRVAANAGGMDVPMGGPEVEIPAAHLARVRTGMRMVVTHREGTAFPHFRALDGIEGVLVYGKTGTAQPGWKFEGYTKEKGPWHLWFVGYAERAGSPQRLAFAMVLHARDTGSGGDAAAPAVARFLSWWYRSRP